MNRMVDGPSKNMVKQKAIRCLQQKKIYQQQLDQLNNQSFNLSQTAFALDTVKETKTTVSAMKSTLKTFHKEMKGVNLTEVEDLYDNMADMNDEANELQEILAQPMGMPDIDEAELDAEFAALGAEMDFDKALDIPGLPSLATYDGPTVDSKVYSRCVPLRFYWSIGQGRSS